jgi:hypothetical protein
MKLAKCKLRRPAALPFGPQRRKLPDVLEDLTLSFLQVGELGALFLASHDASRSVVSYLSSARQLHIHEPESAVAHHALGMSLAFRWCRKLQTVVLGAFATPQRMANLDWPALFGANRLTLRRVEHASPMLSSAAYEALALCPQLEAFAYDFGQSGAISEQLLQRLRPQALPKLQSMTLSLEPKRGDVFESMFAQPVAVSVGERVQAAELLSRGTS